MTTTRPEVLQARFYYRQKKSRELQAAGWTLVEISKHIGCGPSMVLYFLTQPMRPPPR